MDFKNIPTKPLQNIYIFTKPCIEKVDEHKNTDLSETIVLKVLGAIQIISLTNLVVGKGKKILTDQLEYL